MRVPQTQFDPVRYAHLQRACFLKNGAAYEQFRAWNARIDWDDHLNTDEFRLLPQLVRNLSAQNFEHALFGKFRGIGRKAWVTNNLLFRELAPTLRNLRDANIETLVLYGGAFALRYDSEYPLAYNASDCGILVRETQARDAYKFLAQTGWQPAPEISERVLDKYIAARFFHAFFNARGEQIILQWQLIPHCNSVDADAEFWRDAQETKMGDVAVLTLNPTAQLAHTALFGAHARGASPMQRASDVLLLLNACAKEIEWEKFYALLQTHCVVLPIRETLEYAARMWNETAFEENDAAFAGNETAFVPRDKINALPISPQEKTERALWHATSKRERAEKIWRTAARRSGAANVLQGAAAFPQFLLHWWGLEGAAQLPPRALSALYAQRIRR
jgi:hypothetical protein